jgi:hypothetical protein
MNPGEKRRRQAKRARDATAYEAAMAPLRAAGASCATCRHNAPMPGPERGRHCAIDSDFHGYTVVKPDGLCALYSRKGDQP